MERTQERVCDNPTDAVSLDFAAYCLRKRFELQSMTKGGQPDYAFGGDLRLRAALGAVAPLRVLAEAMTSAIASIHRHHALMDMAKVTPTQFHKLFEIAQDCSLRLHLPVPTLFVESSPAVNAYTIATDDRAPFIVISSACANLMSEDELRFVIGHECGHIHNRHGVYNFMGVLAANATLAEASFLFPAMSFLRLAQQGMQLGLAAWSRAGEITCDRAGAICVRDLKSPATALSKLVAPFVDEQLGVIDPLEIVKQATEASHSTLRLEEAWRSHPLTGKRILAVQKFMTSDIFFRRRPDLEAVDATKLTTVDKEVESLLSTAHRL